MSIADKDAAPLVTPKDVSPDLAVQDLAGVIPTTALAIPITRLKRRKRIPASYMALTGDFRPLSLSEDYNRFVKGPLQAVLDASSAFELSLGAEIDCGRSWELPVLIAHWLEAHEITDRPFFWATGMVDGDLAPLPGDYHIATKIAVSRNEIPDWTARFGRVVAVLPPMPADEAEAAYALFAAEGVTAHTVSSFTELETLLRQELGLAPATPALALAEDTLAIEAEALTDLAPPPRWRWLWIGGSTVATVAVLSTVWVTDFGSVRSTLTDSMWDNRERVLVPLDPALSIFGLYAKDRDECIRKTMTGAPLDPKAATQTVTGVALKTGPELCAVEFRNHSTRNKVEMVLQADLVSRGIPGTPSATTSIPLAPSQSRIVTFARPPEISTTEAEITEITVEGPEVRHLRLRFE